VPNVISTVSLAGTVVSNAMQFGAVGVIFEVTVANLKVRAVVEVLQTAIVDNTELVAGEVDVLYKVVHVVPGFCCPKILYDVGIILFTYIYHQ
jgi:hypothetical protein